MATITITANAQDLTDLVGAYSLNYIPTLPDGSANPETQTQFAKRMLRDELNQRIKQYRLSQASANNGGLTIS